MTVRLTLIPIRHRVLGFTRYASVHDTPDTPHTSTPFWELSPVLWCIWKLSPITWYTPYLHTIWELRQSFCASGSFANPLGSPLPLRPPLHQRLHCDCDACTFCTEGALGAKKKCNGVEKLPYAPDTPAVPCGVKVQVMGNDMVWRCKEAHTSTPFGSFASPAVHMAHLVSPKEGFALKNWRSSHMPPDAPECTWCTWCTWCTYGAKVQRCKGVKQVSKQGVIHQRCKKDNVIEDSAPQVQRQMAWSCILLAKLPNGGACETCGGAQSSQS